MHPTRQEFAASETKEDLVQSILAVLQRTYTTTGPTGPTADLAEFFRALDEPTLRAVAYQHGVFEEIAEAEPEREERPDSGE